MRLQELRKELKSLLKIDHPTFYSKEIDLLLSHVLSLPINTIFFSDPFVSEFAKKKLYQELHRLQKGEPLTYLLGEMNFFGCKLTITPDVLIPRQETEILVGLIAHQLSKKELSNFTIWDVCTGSGCIGISLKKKFPSLKKVVLSDLSVEALKLAKINSEKNNVEVEFRQGDLLTPFTGEKANMIVSNPPYVSISEYETLEPSVKNYEPKLALIAEEEGLFFYKEYSRIVYQFLEPDGTFWLEIGASQGERIITLFKKPYSIEILKDLAGHDRFVKVKYYPPLFP